jgi:hypothetical protein
MATQSANSAQGDKDAGQNGDLAQDKPEKSG